MVFRAHRRIDLSSATTLARYNRSTPSPLCCAGDLALVGDLEEEQVLHSPAWRLSSMPLATPAHLLLREI